MFIHFGTIHKDIRPFCWEIVQEKRRYNKKRARVLKKKAAVPKSTTAFNKIYRFVTTLQYTG